MIDKEQISKLDLQNVEPEHIMELGNDVVEALRTALGDDVLKEIYEAVKGESAEGFGERFAAGIEQYIQEHEEIFSAPDKIEENDVTQEQDIVKENIRESLDDLREKYQTMRDTHLSRNIFVSWEKLRVDMAARNLGEVGADGKYKVSGGTLAVDVLGIIRGNIFETVIEEVVRGILDSIFPADKDPVTVEEDLDVRLETKEDVSDITKEMEQIGEMGVHDNGLIEDISAIDKNSVYAIRAANPLFGQHFGFDMTRQTVDSGSMKVWRGGFHDNVDAVVSGKIRSMGIPNISMVELHGNYYHVSPFGKILNSEIQATRTELPIGQNIPRLDISSGKNKEVFEALAANQGCTVEELKERYTGEVQEAFIDRIETGLEKHGLYIEETALPEVERLKESYESDKFILDSREVSIKKDIEGLKEDDPDVDTLKSDMEDKLKKISGLKEEIDRGISRCESREERLKGTLEQYAECREALQEKGMSSESRYMLVSNIEKEAYGRTEVSNYVPKEVDQTIKDFISDEKEALYRDIELYNEKNPDNSLHERDGNIYNRFGISETGKYNPDMCDDAECPETEDKDELDEFIKGHNSDGFVEFKDYLMERSDADPVEIEEDPNDSKDVETEGEKLDEEDKKNQNAMVENEDEAGREKVDNSEEEPPDSVDTESVSEHSDDEILLNNDLLESEVRKDREEGGFDGDAQEVVQENTSLDSNEVKTEKEELTVDPVVVAQAPEDAVPEILGGKDDDEADRENEKDESDPDNQEDYEKIIDGFQEYLENDTFSFSDDLVPELTDLDMQVVDEIMVNALRDLYLETDETQNERLFSLTMEVASFSENGIMPTIESLVEGLKEKGVSDFDIAHTLNDMEPVVLDGIDELMSISSDDVEQRVVRIGDDIWTVTVDSIVNNVTGLEEDPEQLADLVINAVDKLYGEGIGDIVIEQTEAYRDSEIESNNMDFLDIFFNNSLENTLHQVMQDMMPESVREDFINDTSVEDQLENDVEQKDAIEYEEGFNENDMVMPEIEESSFYEDL